ncbi:MAG: hypothetical protein MUF64_20105 [Polyangiaceae bacterium]|nr:hypothetical protein [Polyangiaceae bacterium]
MERFGGVSCCVGGDLMLVAWNGRSTFEANHWLIQRARRTLKTLPSGGLLLQSIEESAAPPDMETRRYIQHEYSDLLPQTRCFVTVPLGNSFHQTVVRTIMRGMLVVSGMSHIAKVAPTLEEGFTLLLEKSTSKTPPRAVALQKIHQMRAAFPL